MKLEVTQRCGVCRCYVDPEDLFCANCGTENPLIDGQLPRMANKTSHYSFDCQGCGASMNYDARAQALRCPFCGSTQMEKREAAQSVVPDWVLPFGIKKTRAEEILRKWLSSGFWRPTMRRGRQQLAR